MTLDVIGAGWGRTGTRSTKLALERLGFGPCDHMIEVFRRHPEHNALWRREPAGDWYESFDARISEGWRNSGDLGWWSRRDRELIAEVLVRPRS